MDGDQFGVDTKYYIDRIEAIVDIFSKAQAWYGETK